MVPDQAAAGKAKGNGEAGREAAGILVAAAALASIGAFIGAFWVLGVARAGAGAVTIATRATAAIRDSELDDEAREKAVQRASIQLIGTFFSILIRSALALLASFLPIWVAGLTGLAATEDVIAFLSRWDVIVIVTVVVVAGYFVGRRLWPPR